MRAPPTRSAVRRPAPLPTRARGRTASRRRDEGRRSLLDECLGVARPEEAHSLAVLGAVKDGGTEPERDEKQPAQPLGLPRAAMLVDVAEVPAQVLDVEPPAM